VNGDLRLFRKRWWGSWAIGATILLALCFLVPEVFEPNTTSKGMHAGAAAAVCGLMIAALLWCYAPWSFFWLIRAFALLGFGLGIWYLVEEARRGRYVTEHGGQQSVLQAVRFLLVWGLPCLWIALFRRPRRCPYDEHGRPRPFEVERTFRVAPVKEGAPGFERIDPVRKVKFDYAGMSKIEVLDANPPGSYRVTLPLDETGVAIWRDWERRIAEVGHVCTVVRDEPGRRTFVNAVLHSAKDRWMRGRRVAVEPKPRA
jgi:hypothetical protein